MATIPQTVSTNIYCTELRGAKYDYFAKYTDKEFQVEETGISPLHNVNSIYGFDVSSSKFRTPIANRFSHRVAEVNNIHEQEEEKEKDQIQYIHNAHVQPTVNGHPHGLLYLNRKHLGPKNLPDSPLAANRHHLPGFRGFMRDLDSENEGDKHGDDSGDFTTTNQESLRTMMFPTSRRSPRKRAPIPLIKPIPETQENMIKRMIEDAEPNTLIHLPAMDIRLPYLRLTKPVTIQGVPGSEIRITEGPILIDLESDNNKSGNKVVFCECTIHSEYSKQRLLDNINTRSDSRRGATTQKESEDSFKLVSRKYINTTKSDFNTVRSKSSNNSLALFQVNSGSVLEIRDCQIKSLFKESLASPDEYKMMNEVQDIAVWLHNDHETLDNPVVMISSTTLTGFHTLVLSEPNCSSLVSRCFISGSRGHALNFENPKTVKVSDNIFEKTTKSPINIKFSKASIDDKPHNISIKNNEINHSHSYGISIFGEHCKPLNVSILIDANKISYSRKDSIGVKFLNIPELKISHNEIKNSRGNGISLQNVFDTVTSTQVYLRKNNIQNSEGNGIILKDCPILMENEEVIKNGKNGLFIVLEDYGKDGKDQSTNVYQKLDFRMILNNCKIQQNAESGINLSGSLKGPMIINSCVMTENLYGIYLTEKESSSYDPAGKISNASMNRVTTTSATSPAKSKDKKKSKTVYQKSTVRGHCHFSIEKSEITRNNIAGIYLKKLVSEMYAAETYISMNKEQAIFIEDSNDRDLIKLKDQDKHRFAEYFHGYVGGYWGELYEGRIPASKNNCKMF